MATKGFENLVNVKADAERIAKMSDADLNDLYFATDDEEVLALIDAETDARDVMRNEPLTLDNLNDRLHAETF